MHRNYGRFQIDDGEWQNIVPFLFGIGGKAELAPYSDQIFPVLSSISGISPSPGVFKRMIWVLSFRFPGIGTSMFDYRAVHARFGSPVPIEEGIRYSLFHGVSDFLVDIGELRCVATADLGPLCTMEVSDNQFTQELLPEQVIEPKYVVHPGNIGHKRIDGESEDGVVKLTALRLDYD